MCKNNIRLSLFGSCCPLPVGIVVPLLPACLLGLPACATFAGQAGCFGEGRCPATSFNPSQVNRSSYMYAAATFGVYGDLCALEKIIMMRSIYVFRLTELFVSVNIGSVCLEKLSYGADTTICAPFFISVAMVVRSTRRTINCEIHGSNPDSRESNSRICI